MSAQSSEINWLTRLEAWAEECTTLAASIETRADQSDAEAGSAEWQERFWEVSQLAAEVRERLSAEETADAAADMIALDTKARELDAALRPFIEGEPNHDAAEVPEDNEELEQTTENDQYQDTTV
ncbi:hypothetical protein GCM10028778_00100 [Barrientosiimonas marina]|uniref:Uncharacterized protein n=1 Tax=Lentibacillus kimchii TaxID=1542911 RepID=A0ABW2URA2_9BACI